MGPWLHYPLLTKKNRSWLAVCDNAFPGSWGFHSNSKPMSSAVIQNHQTNLIRSHLGPAGRQWQSWEATIKAPDCSKNPHCWCEDFLMCPLLGCLSFLPLLLFPSHSDIIESLLLGLIFLCLHHVHGFLSLLLVDFFISSLSAFLPEFTLFLMEFLLWFSPLSSHSLCSSTIPQL